MPTAAAALAVTARRLRPTRAHLGMVVAIVVALWVLLAFGRVLAQLNEANARVDGVRTDNAALQLRLEQASREAQVLQSDAYVRFAARAYGVGRPGERAFALEPGAPPAPVVEPLGGPPTSDVPASPLDSWLRLLFGD
ncbi:MAG: hypothetical protein M3N29_06540 [Chloroflexota bacterium]|nr:hypothetical protein [Chloroflexota bacterium]